MRVQHGRRVLRVYRHPIMHGRLERGRTQCDQAQAVTRRVSSCFYRVICSASGSLPLMSVGRRLLRMSVAVAIVGMLGALRERCIRREA